MIANIVRECMLKLRAAYFTSGTAPHIEAWDRIVSETVAALGKVPTREEKLTVALRELVGFAERNVERAKRAFEAEKAKPHDADSTDLDVAEARYHDAQRFYLVVNERVKEALAP